MFYAETYFSLVCPFLSRNLNPLYFLWSIVEIVQLVLEKKISKHSQCFVNILLVSPLGKGAWPFIWINLNSIYPRMLCAKFGWNKPSGSGEDDNDDVQRKKHIIGTDAQDRDLASSWWHLDREWWLQKLCCCIVELRNPLYMISFLQKGQKQQSTETQTFLPWVRRYVLILHLMFVHLKGYLNQYWCKKEIHKFDLVISFFYCFIMKKMKLL